MELQLPTLYFQFCIEVGELFLFRRHLARPLFVFCTAQTPVTVAQPGEDGLHAIVVALENGIELVIVTTRTADCEPE